MKIFSFSQWILPSVMTAAVCMPLHAQEFADDFSQDSVTFNSGSFDSGSGIYSITEQSTGLGLSITNESTDTVGSLYIESRDDGDRWGMDFTHLSTSDIASGFATAFLEAYLYSVNPDYRNTWEGSVEAEITVGYDAQQQLAAFYCVLEEGPNGQTALPDACGQFEGLDLQFDQSYRYDIQLDRENSTLTLSIDDASQVIEIPQAIYPPHQNFKRFQLFHSDGTGTANASLNAFYLEDQFVDMAAAPPALDRYTIDFDSGAVADIQNEKLVVVATSDTTADRWTNGALRLQQPGDYFEAELTLASDSIVGDADDRILAGIEGIFYNALADGGTDGRNGDVRGSINLEARGDGLRRIEACLVQFNDAEGNARTGLVNPESDNSCINLPFLLEYDETYRVSMALDRAASTFTFRVNGYEQTSALSTDFFAAADPYNWVSISSRNGGIANGTIDNIRSGATALTNSEQQDGLTEPVAFPAPFDPASSVVDSTITNPIDFFNYDPQYDFVDDFSGITTDFGFWSGRERGGSGVAWADGAVIFETSTADGNDDGNYTEFYLDPKTDLLEAVVSLSSESRFEPGNTGAEIQIRATFFNDTQEYGFNEREGDLEAALKIQYEGDGRRRFRVQLRRRDAEGSTGDNLLDGLAEFEEGIAAQVPELDQPYKLTLAIDRESGVLRYGLDDQITEYQIPTGVFLPSQRRVLVSVNHYRGTGVAVGKIHSIRTDTIDEDFSNGLPVLAPYAPTWNAQRPGRLAEVVDGRLRLEADGNLTTGRDPGLEVLGASDYVGAELELSSESVIAADGRVHVEVHGILYNDLPDGQQPDSSEGRVFSAVRLTADGNGERFVQHCAYRSNTADFSDSTELFGGDADNCPRFNLVPELDTTYEAFIKLDREAATLTYGFGGETVVYNIATSIGNARPFNGVRARATDNSKVVALVDNLAFDENPLPLADSTSLLVADNSANNGSSGSVDSGSSGSGGGSGGFGILLLMFLSFLRTANMEAGSRAGRRSATTR